MVNILVFQHCQGLTTLSSSESDRKTATFASSSCPTIVSRNFLRRCVSMFQQISPVVHPPLPAQILETAPDADPSSVTISNQPSGIGTKVSTLKGRTLQNLGLRYVTLAFNMDMDISPCFQAWGYRIRGIHGPSGSKSKRLRHNTYRTCCDRAQYRSRKQTVGIRSRGSSRHILALTRRQDSPHPRLSFLQTRSERHV
jgi:hypothetical protein